MKIDLYLIGFGISLGLSTFFLYFRKSNWLLPKVKWIIAVSLFVIGFLGLTLTEQDKKIELIFFYHLLIPFLFLLLDKVLQKLSFLTQGRDFYLYLRGSSEIDDTLFGSNPHITTLDILFSWALFLFIFISVIFGYEPFFGSVGGYES